MDEIERKIKKYFDQIEPDPAFRETLLGLEDAVKPSRTHSHRRYLLPVAAALAIVLAVGGGWRYLKATMPQPLPEPPAAIEEPAASADEAPGSAVPAPANETAPERPDPDARKPAAQTPDKAESAPKAEAPAEKQPENRPTAPEGGEAGPKAEKTPAPASEPAAEAPPESEPPKPVEPSANEPPVPEEPGSLPEDDPTEEPGALPEDDPTEGIPDPPAEEEPPKEPEPPAPITLSAGFYSSGGQDFVSVTNAATGETVTFDVTGQCPAPIKELPVPSQSEAESEANGSAKNPTAQVYRFLRSAFGSDIVITVTRDADGGSYAFASPMN